MLKGHGKMDRRRFTTWSMRESIRGGSGVLVGGFRPGFFLGPALIFVNGAVVLFERTGEMMGAVVFGDKIDVRDIRRVEHGL